MKKIIVNPRDNSAVEVRLNNAIRHCMYVIDYKRLVKKECKMVHQLVDIIFSEEWPGIIEHLLKARNYEEDKVTLNLKEVVKKVAVLMNEGFHAQIVRQMLRCATGGGVACSDFQVKFEAAMDEAIRLDFWGTTSRFPLLTAEFLLEDMEAGINIFKPSKEELKKSQLMQQMVEEKALKEFIAKYNG